MGKLSMLRQQMKNNARERVASRKHIRVIGLGGTISMTTIGSEGGQATLDAIDLIANVSDALGEVQLSSVQPFILPSASMGLDQFRLLLEAIEAAELDGVDGIVITHGTDSLEETAFALSVCQLPKIPIVLTGAMRRADDLSADGPVNIANACITAATSMPEDMGPLVLFNSEVFSARHVTKSDSVLANAFSSFPSGPIGRVIEGKLQLISRPVKPLVGTLRPGDLNARVGVVGAGWGRERTLLDCISSKSLDGVVIAGLGAGHVSQDAVGRMVEINNEMPVIVASRCASGTTLTRTYGFAGGEIDLWSKGMIFAGGLSASKASVLLEILLSDGASRENIKRAFAVLG